ncbi:MAG: hypothetical protein F6K31_40020, partial [Symploca sp. SIO2G7]|nr:hypothetical protein [Symploca sp. SIO2G7]
GTPGIPLTSQQSKEFSLSTAKIGLGDGDSWLTYYFDAKETAIYSNFPYETMEFAINHIEHQIQPIDGITNYLASSWLSFVIPLDKASGLVSNIGPITIPIPLRSYPTPPSITGQTAQYSPTVRPGESLTIAKARQWSYDFSYRSSDAAQDTIDVQVDYNIPTNELPTELDNVSNTEELETIQNLPTRLAQFISVYPAIQKDFVKYLAQVNIQTKKTDSTFVNAKLAIQAFAMLVTNVAEAWSTWNQINPRNSQTITLLDMDTDEAVPNVQYAITELEDKETGNLHIQVAADAGNTELSLIPIINIAGYTRKVVNGQTLPTYQYLKDGNNLKFNHRLDVPDRQAVLENVDIISFQNAWSAASITRNLELVSNSDGNWLSTNQRFLYKTPVVRFYNQLNPLLASTDVIEIAKIKSENQRAQTLPLENHLANLFSELMNRSNLAEIFFKVESEYQYSLPNNGMNLTLPVLLTTVKSYKQDSSGSISLSEFTNALKTWFNNAKPMVRVEQFTNKGKYLFKLSIFSNFNTKVPMLKLMLSLAIENISDLG